MTVHNIVRYADSTADRVNVTAYINDRMYVADENHPQIDRIVTGLENSLLTDAELADLFDATNGVLRKFQSITERVSLSNGVLYFDGDPVVQRLSDTIVRLMRANEDFNPMVRFLDNLMQNPNEHSRSMLFDWMVANGGFTITPDGHFIAYKGVRSDGRSISAGPGIVNGEQMHGHLPNDVGNVITMPRSDVQFDSHVGCSVGLHVGVWDYAHSFGGGNTLKVKVNPRDVVSVPTDCGWQKMRVCRYEVLEQIIQPVTDVVDRSAVDDDWVPDNEFERNDLEMIESITVPSDTKPDLNYIVEVYWDAVEDMAQFVCSCPSFHYSGEGDYERWCKHTDRILREKYPDA